MKHRLMKLPPSLESIVGSIDPTWHPVVLRALQEACRIQRSYCQQHFENKGDDIENTVLAVELE